MVLAVTTAVGVAMLTGCSGAATAGASTGVAGVRWGSCTDWLTEVKEFSSFTGVGEVSADIADRLECASIDVPLDYESPQGRTVTLALSRLLPSGGGKRTVFTNPGGPGNEGRLMPISIAQSGMAELTKTSTLVGVDIRGTGESTQVSCPELRGLEGTVVEGEGRSAAVAVPAAVAAATTSCVAKDREFFQNLTTQNVAKDFDRIRSALGLSTVDFFGVSWGTELGAAYLSAFPETVGRVLLDSVVDLRYSAEKSLEDAVSAAIEFGGDAQADDGAEEAVSTDADLDAPEGEDAAQPDLGRLLDFLGKRESLETRLAITCNAYEGASEPGAQQEYLQRRIEKFGAAAATVRPGHPLTIDVDVSACTDWPFAPTAIAVKPQKNVTLQLVGHAKEQVTPVAWAEHAHTVLGGDLVILPDGDHGSLATSDRAGAAVSFLVDGEPIR